MTLTSSSLNDTKWRNENTGDWDIGFFENFAVYDCKFWNYESINVKGDKYDIQLRNDEDLLVIRVDKEKDGNRNMQIGQNNPQPYSNMIGKYIPYYPKTDVDTALIDNGYSRIDTVTIIGWLKDIRNCLVG